MSNYKYFIWRFSDAYPYRLYGTRKHIMPADDDMRCIWRGDNEADALEIMVQANKGRREQKKAEHLQRAAENRRVQKLEQERLKASFWNRGTPKEGGTIFG